MFGYILNPGLRRDRPATKRLSHYTTWKHCSNLNYVQTFTSYRAENTSGLGVQKPTALMQYRELIDVCSEIRTDRKLTLCAERRNFKRPIHSQLNWAI